VFNNFRAFFSISIFFCGIFRSHGLAGSRRISISRTSCESRAELRFWRRRPPAVASWSPTVELTEAVIGGCDRSGDFPRFATAFSLRRALNQPHQAVRRLVTAFLDRFLDPHEWDRPNLKFPFFTFC
jgi:hypothetical protein